MCNFQPENILKALVGIIMNGKINHDAISERQVLEYLEKKKEALTFELKKVNLAINALNPGDSIIVQNFVGNNQLKILEPVDEYFPSDKLDNKIAYVLNKKGNADKKLIIKEIKTVDPEIDDKKLERSISVRLSYLLNNRLIFGEKLGRNYSYELIKI